MRSGGRLCAVLGLVECAVRGVLFLDAPPPRLVVAIPLHRGREAGFEVCLWNPAEAAQLRGIERVPAVVTGPVRDRRNERVGAAGQRENAPRQVDVADLVPAADVVD